MTSPRGRMQDEALMAPRGVEPLVMSGDVLGLIADSVICTDHDGHIRLFNRAAEQAFGYPASEVIGQHVEMLLPERHRLQHAEQVRSFASGDDEAGRIMGHRREVCGQRKNGDTFPAEATVSRQTVNGRTVLTVVVRDITERKILEAQRDAIARELDHRIRNVLSVVNSLVSLAARSAASVDDFKESLLARLSALARTQAIIRRGAPESTRLSELLLDELAHYRSPDEANVSIDCPTVLVSSKAAQTLALAFHELATNSAKYGALSHSAGRVTVASAFIGEGDTAQITIEWRETGGPRVSPPTRLGFGTALIKQVIERTFRADVSMEYRSEGLVCRMTLPRAGIEGGQQSEVETY